LRTMGLFGRKKSSEVVDLSDMQKRGLLKREARIPESNTSGVVDFSSSSGSSSTGKDVSRDVDFLSGLAGAGVDLRGSNESYGNVTDSLRAARRRNIASADLNEMKLKVDDNEFKIEQLNEKIKELEMKLREVAGF
jgi:hypothetical protein